MPTTSPGCTVVGIERLERFVGDLRRPVAVGRGGGEDVEPARRDDGRAERHVAWIDEMNAHARLLQNDEASFLPKREKKPAVATAAFCDPRPMATPASAAALHGVGEFSAAGAGIAASASAARPSRSPIIDASSGTTGRAVTSCGDSACAAATVGGPRVPPVTAREARRARISARSRRPVCRAVPPAAGSDGAAGALLRFHRGRPEHRRVDEWRCVETRSASAASAGSGSAASINRDPGNRDGQRREHDGHCKRCCAPRTRDPRPVRGENSQHAGPQAGCGHGRRPEAAASAASRGRRASRGRWHSLSRRQSTPRRARRTRARARWSLADRATTPRGASRDRSNHRLPEGREVVAALHVRPLVRDDAVDLVIREFIEKRRRQRDDGRQPAENRRRLHAVRQGKFGRPSRLPQPGPAGKPRFEVCAGDAGIGVSRAIARRAPWRAGPSARPPTQPRCRSTTAPEIHKESTAPSPDAGDRRPIWRAASAAARALRSTLRPARSPAAAPTRGTARATIPHTAAVRTVSPVPEVPWPRRRSPCPATASSG